MKRSIFVLFSLLIVSAMLLAACGKATPAATEAAATEAPAAVETEAAVPAVEMTETNGLLSMVSPDCDYGGEFKSIEAVDEYTVKFTMCNPDPAFPSKVAFSVFAIQDSDYLNANSGDSVLMSEEPNGTGPYKVVAWNRGDSVVYVANDDYWGEKALT